MFSSGFCTTLKYQNNHDNPKWHIRRLIVLESAGVANLACHCSTITRWLHSAKAKKIQSFRYLRNLNVFPGKRSKICDQEKAEESRCFCALPAPFLHGEDHGKGEALGMFAPWICVRPGALLLRIGWRVRRWLDEVEGDFCLPTVKNNQGICHSDSQRFACRINRKSVKL